MALEMKQTDNFTGTSTINGVIAERYTATIDEENPQNLTFGRYIANGQLRKDNREQCRADQAKFEDDVYAIQNEMIETDSVKEEVMEEEAMEEEATETEENEDEDD